MTKLRQGQSVEEGEGGLLTFHQGLGATYVQQLIAASHDGGSEAAKRRFAQLFDMTDFGCGETKLHRHLEQVQIRKSPTPFQGIDWWHVSAPSTLTLETYDALRREAGRPDRLQPAHKRRSHLGLRPRRR